MASTFNWAQRNGASPGTNTELAGSGNVFNYKNADTAVASDYSSNAITKSDSTNQGNSYEVWLRGHWTGTFTSVSALKFWKSNNFSPATGLTDKFGQTATYATPTTNDSTVANGTMPTSQPGSANVGIAGSTGGSLSAAGYSDYIVTQLHAGLAAANGDTSLATYSLQWTET